jgi:predicted nuclease of restriction endonuclease-like (RecB) superfamily
MLEHWIDSGLYSRQGNAVTNFKQVLPPQSDLANEIVRDPYNFDFLTLRTQAAERELESGPCRTFPAPLRHGPLRFIASPCHI